MTEKEAEKIQQIVKRDAPATSLINLGYNLKVWSGGLFVCTAMQWAAFVAQNRFEQLFRTPSFWVLISAAVVLLSLGSFIKSRGEACLKEVQPRDEEDRL
jgi:hypothetical protein